MNDCPNADVRDLLPDLVHGRLSGEPLRAVEAHLTGCADCRAELALLEALRAGAGTPRVDVNAIVAALPAYRAPVRRSWVGWRVAAAITVVAAGASSLVVARGGSRMPDSVRVAPVLPRVSSAAPSVSVPAAGDSASMQVPAPVVREPRVALATPPNAPEGELAMAGGTLTELSDQELATLLKDIEAMDALPTVEVESANVAPLAPRRGTP